MDLCVLSRYKDYTLTALLGEYSYDVESVEEEILRRFNPLMVNIALKYKFRDLEDTIAQLRYETLRFTRLNGFNKNRIDYFAKNLHSRLKVAAYEYNSSGDVEYVDSIHVDEEVVYGIETWMDICEVLTEKEKGIFALYYVKDMTLQEIAEHQGCSIMTIWKIVLGIKNKVKEIMLED